jgi:hypothetical protein
MNKFGEGVANGLYLVDRINFSHTLCDRCLGLIYRVSERSPHVPAVIRNGVWFESLQQDGILVYKVKDKILNNISL